MTHRSRVSRIVPQTFVALLTVAGVAMAGPEQRVNPDEHPEGEKIRVACVGDSITYGYGIEDRERRSYPAVLQRLLGPRFEVGNLGVSGDTLLKEGDQPYWTHIEEVDAFKPDVVILKLGSNDSKPQNWEHREQFDDDLSAMIERFKELPSEPKVWVCYPAAVYEDQFGIRDKIVRQQRPIIDEVAGAHEVPVIDTYAPFKGRGDYFLDDGVHLNAAGARVLAEKVYVAITSPLTVE